MAFTDDFTGTDGQLLSEREGWTLAAGQDVLQVQSNALRKPSSSTDAIALYFAPDDEAAVQRAGADLLQATVIGVVVFATGSTPANTNAYFLRAQTGLTAARVYQINDGVLGTLISNVTTDGTCDNLEMEASVNGAGNTEIKVYQHGTQIGTTATDSSGNRKTSGRRGIMVNTTGSTGANPAIDNYFDNFSDGGGDEITFTLTERPTAFPLKPERTHSWSLAYTGEPDSIEARWVDRNGDPISGQNWTEVDAAPDGGESTFAVSAPAMPGDYRLQVRDGDATATGITSGYVRVGKINVHFGQSQAQREFTQHNDINSLTPTSGIKCTVVYYPANGYTNPAPPTFVDLASGYTALAGGVVARANQIWADNGGEPFAIVQTCIEGTSTQNWLDNDPRGQMTWGLWDLAEAVAEAIEFQVDAISYDQGTADISTRAGWPGRVELLADKFEELYEDENPIFIIHPHPRSDDGQHTWAMRQLQYEKAVSGGRWRLGAWALDHQLESDGNPHQAPGATGNHRRMRRLGRGDANGLYGLSLDIGGPAVFSVQFTNGARTAIDITYAANIEQADGTAYSASPISLPSHLFSVSENSGSTFGYTGFTAAIVASNRVRLTKSDGSWPATTTRVDYLRGIPFGSDNSYAAEYIGPEADMEADRLSKVLTDASGFDGGRGMPLAPIMGTGAAVAEYAVEPDYTTITAPNSNGITVTLTKAELATLRVKAGATVGAAHEPVAIRWERQAGDTTGSPVDGVNVAVTVTA